ncbi:MAG TPA: YbaK/EbsC family protein [Gaiellaceae bacterium]|nr:YbaK/EbsC family protein [Gaiellaceae bacterium]
MTITELTQALDESQIGYELLSHPRTERAEEEAAALEISPDQVAKTIVLVGEHGRARVVVPASERVDLRKAREALGEGKDARLATEDELATAFPMFELGAVPPFGGPPGDRVLIDPRIAERDSIVLEAGSHGESLRMKASDLLSLSKAEVVDVCRE